MRGGRGLVLLACRVSRAAKASSCCSAVQAADSGSVNALRPHLRAAITPHAGKCGTFLSVRALRVLEHSSSKVDD